LLALADRALTAYVLEHDPDSFEMNIMVDASGISALLGSAAIAVTLYSSLFFGSFALCIANSQIRRIFKVSSRWDEVFTRVPGAASIWYPIILFGAVVNNAGLILFKFSWLQAVLGAFGISTNRELMTGFFLFSVVSFFLIIIPAYFVFSAIVAKAQQSLQDSFVENRSG